jgi:hypothetical protein
MTLYLHRYMEAVQKKVHLCRSVLSEDWFPVQFRAELADLVEEVDRAYEHWLEDDAAFPEVKDADRRLVEFVDRVKFRQRA